MSSRKRTQSVMDGGRILRTLGEATSLAAGLRGISVGVAERPVLKRVYTAAETSVFLLKLRAGEDDAPPYDSSLERYERSELISMMLKSLEEAMELAPRNLSAALKRARVARDCAATVLHSVNLESRRTKR